MNVQTIDLNKMGLAPMTEFEMLETDGGSIWAWISAIATVIAAIAAAIATNNN